MVNKTAWCSHQNMKTSFECLTFSPGIHAANSRPDFKAGISIKPYQLFVNLQGKLTRWCDDNCMWPDKRSVRFFIQQAFSNRQSKCDCLA